MDELKFSELKKKTQWVGIRISKTERDELEEFCQREKISITDFIRYSIRKVIKERSQLKGN